MATSWRRTITDGLRLPATLLIGLFALYAVTGADSYELRLLGVAGCYALMVLGYQFIFGHAGGLSLAQGTFFGLGAYISGLLTIMAGLPFVLSFPAAIAGAALVALAISLPVMRLQSHYLALATLGISQVVLLVTIDWVSLTGGSNGVPGIPAVGVLGIGPAGELGYAAFVWAWVAAGAALSVYLLRGRGMAREFEALRKDPIMAAAAGLNVNRLRLHALLLSATFGGAAGALFVHGIGVASPDTLQFEVMITCLCMAVIGGRTLVLGALIGAILLVNLPEWFRFLEHWALVAYGAGLLFVILIAPDGIAGALLHWRQRWFPEIATQPLPASPPVLRATRLEVTGLSKRFGGLVALKDIDMAVATGEILGIIGPNGSGKTTLLNCLGGQYPSDSGEILLNRTSVGRQAPWRRAAAGLARTFQQGATADRMLTLDVVAIACRHLAPDQRAGAAMAALARSGAADTWRLPVGALPLVARRRVEIARALAQAPGILLLDEPAAGLTHAEQTDLADLLRSLNAEGLTLVIADHNMGFLLPLAGRLICLDTGRIIAAGTPGIVTADPRVITAYLGRGAANG